MILTYVNNTPPGCLLVDKCWVGVVREQRCQCTSRIDASLSHIGIELSGLVALMLDTPLRPTKAWSSDQYFGAQVVHLEEQLLTFNVWLL